MQSIFIGNDQTAAEKFGVEEDGGQQFGLRVAIARVVHGRADRNFYVGFSGQSIELLEKCQGLRGAEVVGVFGKWLGGEHTLCTS